MSNKMYSNKPIIETTETFNTKTVDYQKRIDELETQVRKLTEQIHQMASALKLNSRQMRRANTDITNLTTVLRNRT